MSLYKDMSSKCDSITAKKRVAAYCRVSTNHEDQSNSFENQRNYFSRFIANHPDWELYEIFADEGISGTSTKKRREFNRMIACAQNGAFDLIITKEISRFARNTLDSIYYTRDLKKRGIGVIFLNDGINTMDGDAELRLAIMASIAQEESRRTSERVKWGQKRQMEQGVVFGHSMLGYDVKDGRMTINEEGAKVVRLIFHKFVNEGKGTHVIARELSEAGIKPMRAKEWSNTVILRMIRNEKYCGDLVQKKTYTPDYLSHEKKYNRGQEDFVIIKNHHEPIISREVFEKAGRILEEKTTCREYKPKYSDCHLFSGKIKCGCCGASYISRNKKRKDGTQYKAWRCYEANRNGAPHISEFGNRIGCSGQSVRNEDVLHIMCLVIRSLNLNREVICSKLLRVVERVIKMDTPNLDVPCIEDKIKTAKDKRLKLLDLYLSDMISKEELSDATNKIDSEINELQSTISSDCRQQSLAQRQEHLLTQIGLAIDTVINGVEAEDVFYRQILDRMIIKDKNHIDVYLKMQPMKWSFAVTSDS